MARLFIIGNGYDISRRGDTSYTNFKKWLEGYYIDKYSPSKFVIKEGKISFETYNSSQSYSLGALGDLVIRNNTIEQQGWKSAVDYCSKMRKNLAIAVLFYSMQDIGDLEWNTFEENLSKIPIDKIIAEYKKTNISCYKNDATLGSPVNIEREKITSLSTEIVSLFTEWVRCLCHKEIMKRGFEKELVKEINNNDTFIIFNYTKTIEDIFKNSNPNIFFHIHGVFDDNKNPIIVGHNCKPINNYYCLDKPSDYDNDFFDSLYKDTKSIIEKNEQLWSRLPNNESLKIYEYGWSCSDVDIDYISKIVDLLGSKMRHLYLNDFNNEGNRKKQQWIKCGLSQEVISLYKEETDKITFIK